MNTCNDEYVDHQRIELEGFQIYPHLICDIYRS